MSKFIDKYTLPTVYHFVHKSFFDDIFELTLKDLQYISSRIEELKARKSEYINNFQMLLPALEGSISDIKKYTNLVELNYFSILPSFKAITENFTSITDISEISNLYIDRSSGLLTFMPVENRKLDLSDIYTAILSSSNGTVYKGRLEDLFDNDKHTIFEYRQSPSVDRLKLNIRIGLNQPTTVNYIKFYPAGNVPFKIVDIQYSNDGQTFVSATASFVGLVKTNRECFFYAPNATHIDIYLEQDTLDSTLNEYAIALSDIEVYSRKYMPAGRIKIVKSVSDSISSFAINLDITDKQLFDFFNTVIKYSTDDSSYSDIKPFINKVSAGDVVSLKNPSNTIYVDISISQKDKMFVQDGNMQVEYFKFAESPAVFNLSGASDPVYVACSPAVFIGNTSKKILVGSVTADTFFGIKLPYNLRDGSNIPLKVYIQSGDNFIPIPYNSNKEIPLTGYSIKENTLYIRYAKTPPSQNVMPLLNFTSENISTSPKEKFNVYISFDKEIHISADAKLPLYLMPIDKRKMSVIKTLYDVENNDIIRFNVEDLLKAKLQQYRLTYVPEKPEEITFLYGDMFVEYVEFIDGKKEFTNFAEYQYSVDTDNRILYLNKAFDTDITIQYTGTEKSTLDASDFDVIYDYENAKAYLLINKNDPSDVYQYEISYVAEVPLNKDFYLYNKDQGILTIIDIDDIKAKTDLPIDGIKAAYHPTGTKDISYLSEYITPVIDNLSIIYKS